MKQQSFMTKLNNCWNFSMYWLHIDNEGVMVRRGLRVVCSRLGQNKAHIPFIYRKIAFQSCHFGPRMGTVKLL